MKTNDSNNIERGTVLQFRRRKYLVMTSVKNPLYTSYICMGTNKHIYELSSSNDNSITCATDLSFSREQFPRIIKELREYCV